MCAWRVRTAARTHWLQNFGRRIVAVAYPYVRESPFCMCYCVCHVVYVSALWAPIYIYVNYCAYTQSACVILPMCDSSGHPHACNVLRLCNQAPAVRIVTILRTKPIRNSNGRFCLGSDFAIKHARSLLEINFPLSLLETKRRIVFFV